MKIPVHKFLHISMAVLLVFAFAFGAAGVQVARAAGLVVNHLGDGAPANDGLCTLREAILNADNDNQSASIDCVAGSGADTIIFSLSGAITLGSYLTISDTDRLTIDGTGQSITVSGNNAHRVMLVVPTAILNLNALTIANGSEIAGFTCGSSGGGVCNFGTLTVTDSTFAGNHADDFGGGIINIGGTLTVSNSIFSGNNSTSLGGGIYNTGTLIVTNSTFSSNTAAGTSTSKEGLGGAIHNNGGTLNVLNSTFVGNTAEGFTTADTPGKGHGGAMYASGIVSIANSTFSANQALGGDNTSSCGGFPPCPFNGEGDANGGAIYILSSSGHSITNVTFSDNVAQPGNNVQFTAPAISGGLFLQAGGMNLKNSILSNSISPFGTDCFSLGTVNQTNNLIESPGNCGAPTVTADPKLGPLQDNSGPTETMALQTGSPAIDAGDDANCPATDQRGLPRPQGSHCDIGAYELRQTFADVSALYPYYEDIEILYANGYTGGCSASPLLFCPDLTMDRAQAAVFMVRGNFGSGYVPVTPTHLFADNWSNVAWAEGWAESMYLEGLSGGCSVSPRLFCPEELFTNVQAAVFGLRMKYGVNYAPPAASGNMFADLTDLNFWGIAWAEQAYVDDLLPACGTSGGKPLFCPDNLVSRGFGASIIVKAKGLTMP